MHLPLDPLDMCLHVMEVGGKFFVNKTLSFGSKSSPGLFDRVSYSLLHMAVLSSGAEWRHTKKCVDDVVKFGLEAMVQKFYNIYKQYCTRVGVHLAPEEEDKAFAISSVGTVLGFQLNLEQWTMCISKGKMDKIFRDGFDIINGGKVETRVLQSFIGRVTHCSRLFRGSLWERGFLLSLANTDSRYVQPSRCTISQVLWWLRNAQAYRESTPIPCIKDFFFSATSVVIYTDAAGGNSSEYGRGMGGVIWSGISGPRKYYLQPWPINIKKNLKNRHGVRLGSKLSMLESTAVLTIICCFGQLLKNRHVVVKTDNIGVVWAMRKKHSRDLYCYSTAKATAYIADKLNIKLRVEKVPRCSDGPTTVADLLSKGDMYAALDIMGEADPTPPYIPRTLMKWLENPTPTRVLGHAILKELIAVRGWSTLPLDFEYSEDFKYLVTKK